MARLAARMGVFELRYGSTEEASRLLAAAVELFGTAGGESEDSVRARWNLAEALAERGRVHEAISEYHKVRTELLARGALVDAAIAAVQILDLHLLAGRESELVSLTGRFLHLFRDAGLPSTRSRRWPTSVGSRCRAMNIRSAPLGPCPHAVTISSHGMNC